MQLRATTITLARVLHVIALYLVGAAAVVAVAATGLAALGVVPWLSVDAAWGATPLPWFGTALQVGLTALLVAIAAFFPSSLRVLALERSHREFRMTMDDVARAYHAAHVADRKGAFTLSSEFDAVRERIEYLRDHPDLKLLEADVLTAAAQMSQQSHRLAQVYSDDRVARARDFLQQRQKEAEEQQARIAEALRTCRDIMRWNSQVELEEAMVASQLQQLDEQLHEVLPALGYSFDGVDRDPEAARHGEVARPAPVPAAVVPMEPRHAAE